ncbi:MAG TPA: phosphocholine cytidylyltransferase family protein [Vicinamibacterales bacterium]|nr:phosphocholine cytidylyltransferase family protein [Vicinamibacterales bacterium]
MRAVILAAGQGMRLRSVVDNRPKGLIELAGESLVARSLRMLRKAGIDETTIVAGYRATQYARFCADRSGLTLVVNDAYATSGSMASFAAALDAGVTGDLLLLESDVVYERRALPAILESPFETATLVSGPTRAGDEVWVDAVDGRLRGLSKRKEDLPSSVGEFVGITKLSADAVAAMREQFAAFVAAHGHGRMDYETAALVGIARSQTVGVVVVPDLQWGEIDDERQYARVSSMIWR